jgi:hypothetical protein
MIPFRSLRRSPLYRTSYLLPVLLRLISLILVQPADLAQTRYKRPKPSDFVQMIASRAKANFDYRLRKIGEIAMQAPNKNPSRAPLRSTAPLTATIRPVKEAAARLKRRVGRFKVYDLLEAIYRVYIDWKRYKLAKRSARIIADEMNIVRRKGMSTIRVLIDAVNTDADFKQKSRWVRALEYVYSENVSPSRFRKFVRTRGGVAGCARLAVQVNRKRRRPRRECVEGDWDD